MAAISHSGHFLLPLLKTALLLYNPKQQIAALTTEYTDKNNANERRKIWKEKRLLDG